ncbi:MAG: hypothetical protein ALAOOOJD_01546 [bacterium]|nr:hypothetical protein [bacterium]
MNITSYFWLIPLGFIIGTFGTLIGAGGGFVLVPILLLLYPQEDPEIITSISLAVVFFNALSGSVAYMRMRRIDFKSGLLFSITTIPGAILGAISTTAIPRRAFDLILGTLLIAIAMLLIIRPNATPRRKTSTAASHFSRHLIETDGTEHRFSYNPLLAVGVSFLVGYFSSLLGIGGGIIHVPFLSQVLNFPVHVATATSHFTLAIMALAGTLVHVVMGTFHHGVRRMIFLAVGVLAGAQLGAWLSNRVHGKWIIRGLAIALGFVGVHVIMLVW